MLTRLAAVLAIVVGLPAVGAVAAGKVPPELWSFPPRPVAVTQPGFSPLAWILLAIVIAFPIGFAILRIVRAPVARRAGPRGPIPWWGRAGAVVVLLGWSLAWSRLDWFSGFQHHTFTPLWIGYVLFVNGLDTAFNGRCLMTERPRLFAMLFPLSAAFWWLFEYLNRFVDNWHYVHVDHFSPFEYVVHATLAFSTVLPAVLSTAAMVRRSSRIETAFTGLPAIRAPRPKVAAAVTLVPACAALVGIGASPRLFFPLVWIAPTLIVIAIQILANARTGLEDVARGDWSSVFASAFAALVCGYFWELWNWGSLAHWEYAVPYVDRFRMFEMPVLGYAGYLPFGVECLCVAQTLSNRPLIAASPPLPADPAH